jgi:Na+/H+ antiporter NhaD/arsenite permease-like protein
LKSRLDRKKDSTGALRFVGQVLNMLSEWPPPLAANLATAFGLAAVSNLINNLPVGLTGATVLQRPLCLGSSRAAEALLTGPSNAPLAQESVLSARSI